MDIETITGKVVKEIFPAPNTPEYDLDRTTRIFILKPEKRETIKVKYGDAPKLYKNDRVTANGIFNRQTFEACTLVIEDQIQDPKNGIIEFLKSQKCGIGRKRGEELYSVFGEDLLNVINDHPERLRPYLTDYVYDKLVGTLGRFTPEKMAAMTFMRNLNISNLFANRIYRHYKDKTIETIKKDPYILIDTITNFTFAKADGVASRLDIDKNNPSRLEHGILDYMENEEEEHTFLEKKYLIPKITRYLKGAEVIPITKAINRLCKKNKLIMEKYQGKELIYTQRLYTAECNTANKLKILLQNSSSLKISKQKLNSIITKYQLDEDQTKALIMVKDNNISIITGGPGTGKTTLLNAIMEMYATVNIRHCILCAPTGKAAKMMAKNTNMPAATIHSTLGFNYQTGFTYNAGNMLNCNTLNTDEASMINIKLMEDLITAVNNNTRIVIMGDKNQLPAIGAGNVLKDCIESGLIPYTILTHIHRRSPDDLISVNAAHILNGEDLETGPNFVIEETNSIVETKNKLLEYASIMDVEKDQMLVSMKKHENGTEVLNAIIQKKLNQTLDKYSFSLNGRIYKLKDKVMQVRNDYERGVMNGEWGFITKIDPQHKTLTVTFNKDFSGAENEVEYDEDTLYYLIPAYVCTIHKTQGCEYDTVYIGIDKSPASGVDMFNMNLIYTAITRAKKKVVLIGNKDLIKNCIENTVTDKRNSLLKERLCGQI